MNSNYTFDPFVNRAKEVLNEMAKELHRPTHFGTNHGFCTPPAPDFLVSQLNSWHHSNQNLQQHIDAIQIEQPQVLPTLFKFEPDHFKMLVDARGYLPSQLKVTINKRSIEIVATNEQSIKEQGGAGYANRTITRTYEMPANIQSDQVVGNLSPDGNLFLAAPWVQNYC